VSASIAPFAEPRRHRREIDDRAARPAAPRRHAAHRLARAQEGAGEVRRQHALEALERHVLQARLALEDAGVVDQRRDRPERALRGVEHARDLPLGAHVGLQRERAPAGGRDFGDHRFGRRTIAQVVDAHRVAARGREPRGRRADAAARARDQHDSFHAQLPWVTRTWVCARPR
jgi:hypothetical protein